MGTRIIHFLFRYIILPIMSFIDWIVGLVTNYPKQFCVFLFAAVLLTAVLAIVLIKRTIARLRDDGSGSKKSTGIWIGILLLLISVVVAVFVIRYSDKIGLIKKKPKEAVQLTEAVTETETEKQTEEIMPPQQVPAEAETVIETEAETETESETNLKTTEEFLKDFKESYDRRETVYGQNAGARREWMSSEAWNAYLEACVEAERDFYEKYQDASFEDLNIQYLCNQYIDGLRKQYQAVELWKENPDSEDGDRIWLSGYYDRAGVIVEMSDYYDVDIPEKTVATLTGELNSLSEPETGNAEVNPETVLKTQELLNEIGFYCGNADGVAGRRTARMIRRFQEMYGYDPADGLIDDELIDQLEEAAEQKTGRKPAKLR